MKNTIKFLTLVAFMFAAMGVSAQTGSLKLGHIETDKLLKAMPEMTAAEKTLQAKQDEVMKEMQSLRDQFQKAIAEYTEKQKTYSDILRQSKEQEIQGLQQRIQSFEEIATEELKKTQQGLMQPIMDKAMSAIKEVAKENGFTYVFDMTSGMILYASETSQDVLPLVKKKLGLQ